MNGAGEGRRLDADLPPRIQRVAEAINAAGGRALLVGGYVRDLLLGGAPKDCDFEVYGLTIDDLEQVLATFGEVLRVGRAFGVLRVKGYDVDFSLPRRDNKTGRGHRGFAVELDPALSFAEAARRRDLTINSIGLDPLSGEILDPHDGCRDLDRRCLRATDARHFGEDPLRALRVAQFAARFELPADPALVELCRTLDLEELAGERLLEEFRKLLLKGRRPSVGLRFLEDAELLRFFPELGALVGVDQDPRWHPEGGVWIHTLEVVDRAAALRDGGDDDLALMFAALCHDLGKPSTTVKGDDRVTAHGHEMAGVPLAEAFLSRLRAPKELVIRVCGLVRHHLAPRAFVRDGAGARAYRRLARSADESRIDLTLLARLARADHPDDGGMIDRFIAKAEDYAVARSAPRDAVQGRHLIERGLAPGPQFKTLLARCREIQDRSGWDDPQRVLDAALEKPLDDPPATA